MSNDGAQVLYPAPGKVVGAQPAADAEAPPTLVVDVEGVQIGDVFLPRSWIAPNGVVIRPGMTVLDTHPDAVVEDSPGTVTLTLLVGDIRVDESVMDQVALHQRLDHAVGIATSLAPLDADVSDASGGFLDGLLSAHPELAEHLPSEPYMPADADVLSVLDPNRVSGS